MKELVMFFDPADGPMYIALVGGLFSAATLTWLIAVVKLRAIDELHHFWVGVAIVVLGFSCPTAAAIGLYLMIDDAHQHWIQAFVYPPYLSHVHLAWEAAARFVMRLVKR